MNNKILTIIIVAIVAIAGVAGAVLLLNNNGNKNPDYDLSKDAVGRDVVIPNNLEDGIVPVGVGALRWVSYFGMDGNVVMKDLNDNSNYLGKSYLYAVGDTIGALTKSTTGSGSLSNEDVTFILNLTKKPIVVTTDTVYESNNLQIKALEEGGINVCIIYELEDFINLTTFKVSEKFEYQTKLVGEIMKSPARATELINGVNNTIGDIRNLVRNVTPVEGYIGALSYSGAKGITYSSGTYLPFQLANINNAIEGNDLVAEFSVAYLTQKISGSTKIFVDANGSNVMKTGADNENVALIKTFKSGGNDGYIAFPYVWFGLNFDNVLIGAYQLISYVYSAQLSKTAFTEKVNGIYDLFYGGHNSNRVVTASGVPAPTTTTSIYNDMSNVFVNMTGTGLNGWRAPTYGNAYFLTNGTISSTA